MLSVGMDSTVDALGFTPLIMDIISFNGDACGMVLSTDVDSKRETHLRRVAWLETS